MKSRAPLTPPTFCNHCGQVLKLVRPWPVYNVHEYHCDQCDYYAVVHSYDQMALPTPKVQA